MWLTESFSAVSARAPLLLARVTLSTSVSLKGRFELLEDLTSRIRLGKHHAHHPVLGGIHHGHGLNIDFGLGEFSQDLGQDPGFVNHENRKLGGNVHDGLSFQEGIDSNADWRLG